MKHIAVALVCLLSVAALAVTPKEIEASFKGKKYFQVQKDGLAVGICRTPSLKGGVLGSAAMPHMDVTIDGDKTKFNTILFSNGLISACSDVAPEPLQIGELIEVLGVRVSKSEIKMSVRNVDAHEIERGTGTGFEHVNKEHGYAVFKFKVAKDDDAQAIVDRWLTLFDNQKEAARFGGAAVVKQVKLGMNTSEVESALGPPETRVDLDSKLLYKYKDMTVEFHDGKVTDVR